MFIGRQEQLRHRRTAPPSGDNGANNFAIFRFQSPGGPARQFRQGTHTGIDGAGGIETNPQGRHGVGPRIGIVRTQERAQNHDAAHVNELGDKTFVVQRRRGFSDGHHGGHVIDGQTGAALIFGH